MNKKLNYESIILIVLIFLLILYVTKKVIKDNNEGFESDENSKLNAIIDTMSQRNDGAKKEALFDSVDKSIDKSMQKQSTLRFDNASANTDLMDKYIFEKILSSDENNPNPILESGNQYQLPRQDYNREKYNHELRQLNITKQIKQDYIIKVLRHKIDLILNSLKPVQEIKKDIEALKQPENKYLVDILKTK
jgi:regulatory protein YycI of two-component signal transduction system YycFG